MTLRRILSAGGVVLSLAVLAGPAPRAAAQYFYRGGPVYGGAVGGGPTGPSLYIGAYAPSFYGPLPPSYAGGGVNVGFVPTYPSSYPVPRPAAALVTVPPPMPALYQYQNPADAIYNPPPARTDQATGPVTPPTTRPITPAGPTEGSRSAPGAPPATTPPTSPPATGRAQFTVKVPADAKLLVNDAETKQTGASRRFHTPATIEPGRTYEYTFRAQWAEGGQTVTRDRTVKFKAGDDVTVDLTESPAR